MRVTLNVFSSWISYHPPPRRIRRRKKNRKIMKEVYLSTIPMGNSILRFFRNFQNFVGTVPREANFELPYFQIVLKKQMGYFEREAYTGCVCLMRWKMNIRFVTSNADTYRHTRARNFTYTYSLPKRPSSPLKCKPVANCFGKGIPTNYVAQCQLESKSDLQVSLTSVNSKLSRNWKPLRSFENSFT